MKNPTYFQQKKDSRFDIDEKNTFAVHAFYIIYAPIHTLSAKRQTYLHSSARLEHCMKEFGNWT